MELWGIIDGSKTAPAEIDHGAYSKFITRKNCTLASIVLSIDPSLLYLIDDPTDQTVVLGEAIYPISKEDMGK